MPNDGRGKLRSRVASCLALPIVLAMALCGGCHKPGGAATVTPEPASRAGVGSEASEIAALPEGSAKTLVSERCLLCHGAALITQQRKDAAAWGRTVTQMRTWGTAIQDADQTAIVAYLAEHFGPGSTRR
jgi:cytochrome c5